MISRPLSAQGVSRRFPRSRQDRIQLVIVAAPKSEREHLLWNVQLIYPSELEDRFVAKMISESGSELNDIQPYLREDFLRNRFRSYMDRFRLYTPNNKKLHLEISLQPILSPQRRQIIHESRSAENGGKKPRRIEKYASRIASAFAQKGADVSLLTTGIANSYGPGVDSCTFPICRWPGFFRLEQYDRCVRRWLKKNPVDLIFGMERSRIQTHIRAGNGVHAAYLKSRIASEGKLKYAMCSINPLHRKILEMEKAAFESRGSRKSSSIPAWCETSFWNITRSSRRKRSRPQRSRMERTRGSLFDLEEKKAAACQTLGLDPSALHLLFIGNGYRRKGLDELLSALSIWKFKHFHLSVIGKDKKLDAYRAKSEHLGLKGRIRFFGFRQEVVSFYQMADAPHHSLFLRPFCQRHSRSVEFRAHRRLCEDKCGHEILTEQNGAIIEACARQNRSYLPWIAALPLGKRREAQKRSALRSPS